MLHEILSQSYQIENNEKAEICGVQGGEMRDAYTVLSENLRGRNHMGDLHRRQENAVLLWFIYDAANN